MMEALEISEMIKREIGDDWLRSNAHGVDLQKCLVAPTKRAYEDPLREGEMVELWLVLEEMPDDRSGYKIVFDEGSGMFGLATSNVNGPDVFLGCYGSFFETLEAM